MCCICDDYEWGGIEVNFKCYEGALGDCFSLIVKEILWVKMATEWIDQYLLHMATEWMD